MTDALIAGAVGSLAPTAASLLAYANARATRRDNQRNNLGGLAASLEGLRESVQRLEATTGRIETSVGGLRERVAHVEGRLDGAPRALRAGERARS
jgi:predicted  nucleic acid-binding Zn-ribbon protein